MTHNQPPVLWPFTGQLAPQVKNWRILLVQSSTACTPLLTATSTFGLGRRRWRSPQQCYLHCLHTHKYAKIKVKGQSGNKQKNGHYRLQYLAG